MATGPRLLERILAAAEAGYGLDPAETKALAMAVLEALTGARRTEQGAHRTRRGDLEAMLELQDGWDASVRHHLLCSADLSPWAATSWRGIAERIEADLRRYVGCGAFGRDIGKGTPSDPRRRALFAWALASAGRPISLSTARRWVALVCDERGSPAPLSMSHRATDTPHNSNSGGGRGVDP